MSTHFVVTLENRPGALAHLARALAARGIDIREIVAGGAGESGFAFIATDNEVATRGVLAGMGVTFISGATMIVEVDDRPGGLAGLTDRLAAAGIDIRSLAVIGRRGGRAEVALSVDDVEAARRVIGPGSVMAG